MRIMRSIIVNFITVLLAAEHSQNRLMGEGVDTMNIYVCININTNNLITIILWTNIQIIFMYKLFKVYLNTKKQSNQHFYTEYYVQGIT